MFAYLIIYKGKPEDPEAFLRYYVDHHVPLVWKFPNIRDVQIHWVEKDGTQNLVTGHEGSGKGDEIFMITRLIFDSLEDLQAATNSPQRELAREDMKKFPPFKGSVERQVVKIFDTLRP